MASKSLLITTLPVDQSNYDQLLDAPSKKYLITGVSSSSRLEDTGKTYDLATSTRHS